MNCGHSMLAADPPFNGSRDQKRLTEVIGTYCSRSSSCWRSSGWLKSATIIFLSGATVQTVDLRIAKYRAHRRLVTTHEMFSAAGVGYGWEALSVSRCYRWRVGDPADRR